VEEELQVRLPDGLAMKLGCLIAVEREPRGRAAQRILNQASLVEPGAGDFDVQHRGTVQGIQALHEEDALLLIHRKYLDHGGPDWVRPVRGAGGEHPA